MTSDWLRDELRQYLDDSKALSLRLIHDFEAMNAEQRRAVALVEYKCSAKDPCRLMTIWQAPGGRFWYTPAYTLPEARSIAETEESARAKHTEGGPGRWKARAGWLDYLIEGLEGSPAEGNGLGVNCRHLRRNHVISWCDLKAEADHATVGSPTWITLHRDDMLR